MTRRAFLALRVIPLQEEFAFQLSFQRIWFGVRFWWVFQIILMIHEFVCDGVAKINYFDMKEIHFTWGLWKSIGSRRRILTICNSILGRNFRKSDVCGAEVDFGRPCRGLSRGKGFAREKKRLEMGCRDDKQYFITCNAGKIVRNMPLYFLYVTSSARRVFDTFLAIQPKDFAFDTIKN